MTRRFIGVRWWLGAAFAVVAATSTAIVVSQYSSRSENALRRTGEDQAIASAFDAAAQLGRVPLATVERQQGLRLALYDANGAFVRGHRSALDAQALREERYHGSTSDGRVFVVGVPFDGGTLVARDARPDVKAAIGILNDQALKAGVIAGVISLLVGVLLAQLIALRLRRMSRAAEA